MHYLDLGEPPVDTSKCKKGLDPLSSEGQSSMPRRVQDISTAPAERISRGTNAGFSNGDVDEPWGLQYSPKLDGNMRRMVRLNAESRATAIESFESMWADIERMRRDADVAVLAKDG